MTFLVPGALMALALAQAPEAPKNLPKAAATKKEDEKLPNTRLAPAKIFPDLCIYRYRVSTDSPECQAYVDQGFGFYYSYVWMEAARSFETATKLDPNCAMAWWGLSRSCEKWGRGDQTAALRKAKELMPRASDREQKLILARLQEKGLTDEKLGPDQRTPTAIKTIDELLSLYDDDQEAWFYRAQLAGGNGFGGVTAAVPFYKALLRINPLNPGATHEMVHYYENARRPALGFPYAEKYIESSPGIPHPFHMQAHLATRLGRWDKTADRSARAIELERAYHKFQNVEPKDDQQFNHHLEILTISLVHDGRYQEARKIKAEAEKAGYKHWMPWFRLHLGERDWKEVQKVIDNHRKRDKTTAAYLAALLYLKQGDLTRAAAEVDILRQASSSSNRRNAKLEEELAEVQGVLLCKTGAPDEGLKLLQRVVDKTKNDFGHHSWGNGAYYMEIWGLAALEAGRWSIAEEGLLEALAHDPGSVRAALGLEALCKRLDRPAEAERYAQLAKRFWKKADVEAFLTLKEEIAKSVPAQPQFVAPAAEPRNDTKTGAGS
jgi:tetratricopeptide (TPR) repeat protein